MADSPNTTERKEPEPPCDHGYCQYGDTEECPPGFCYRYDREMEEFNAQP